MKNFIDQLPDPLLVDILCRLPSNKLVFQCKCVSKRWHHLISDPGFVARFLCVQRDRKTPIPSTLVLFPHKRPFYEVFKTSGHPAFKKLGEKKNKLVERSEIGFGNTKQQYASNLAFGFVPFYRGVESTPLVAGACNDLVCFSPSKDFPGDFYIINPYTKQWVALSNMPPVHQSRLISGCPMGFICDQYYMDEQQVRSATAPDCTFRVNAEYRWAVVQLVPNLKGTGFHVHMLSSESSGEWRDLVVLFPRDFGAFEIELNVPASVGGATGVAYNGKLYWLRRDNFIFELDPFSNGTNMVGVGEQCIANCRFIAEPEPLIQGRQYLGVSKIRGCLRLCRLVGPDGNDIENENDYRFIIWDLKLDEVPDQGKFKWHKVSMEIPERANWVIEWATLLESMVAFHPNNEDCMYIKSPGYIAKCNLRGTMLEQETIVEYDQLWSAHYPFAIPWWPTPVPRLPARAMANFKSYSTYAPCLRCCSL